MLLGNAPAHVALRFRWHLRCARAHPYGITLRGRDVYCCCSRERETIESLYANTVLPTDLEAKVEPPLEARM